VASSLNPSAIIVGAFSFKYRLGVTLINSIKKPYPALLLSLATSILIGIFIYSSSVYALGNHPEADHCPKHKTFYVFCSHSLHNLEGWIGGCHATRSAAQVEADQHAKKRHAGKTRWTGVLKARRAKY